MSNPRTALRFRLIVILAVTGLMALSTFWLNMVISRSSSDPRAGEQRKEPDYFVFNFNYIKMLPSGKPNYHLTGTKLTHFPADDSHQIDMPVYTNLDKTKPPQYVRSNMALIKEDSTKVHMHGNVIGDRSATATTESLRLETEYLLVFPDEDAMQTDKAVTIKRGNATIQGVGMDANNATGEMRVHHQTSVTMSPKK